MAIIPQNRVKVNPIYAIALASGFRDPEYILCNPLQNPIFHDIILQNTRFGPTEPIHYRKERNRT